MVKTKFMHDGKVIRRSSRNFVDKEEPPPERAPRKGEKSRGGGGKKSETKVAPPLRTSPRKKPKGGTPLRTSPQKKKATVSVSRKSKKKDGSRGNVSLENPEIDGGGSVPELKKTKRKGDGESSVSVTKPTKKAMKKKVSKKRKRTEIEDLSPENLVNCSEEEDQLYEKEDVDPPYSQDEDEFGGVEGDDDANEREEGFEGIVEERCTDLAILGEEARNDECEKDEDEGDDYAWDDDMIPDPMSSDEENEEDMRPAEAYREEMDPVEMLKLGRTFADAEEFKHTCLRYSLTTILPSNNFLPSGTIVLLILFIVLLLAIIIAL